MGQWLSNKYKLWRNAHSFKACVHSAYIGNVELQEEEGARKREVCRISKRWSWRTGAQLFGAETKLQISKHGIGLRIRSTTVRGWDKTSNFETWNWITYMEHYCSGLRQNFKFWNMEIRLRIRITTVRGWDKTSNFETWNWSTYTVVVYGALLFGAETKLRAYTIYRISKRTLLVYGRKYCFWMR